MDKKKNKRSKTSARWLNEHVHDPFTRQAQKDGFRARSAYKLIEIDKAERLMRPGSVIVDLGSAPGSWSQVAAQKLAGRGRIIALDILPMAALPGVEFIQGDFTRAEVLEKLQMTLAKEPVDLVISDIAPNITGMAIIDQTRSYDLARRALTFALSHLGPKGVFLVKVFQGSEYQDYLRLLRSKFKTVVVKKPGASRDRSTEVYLLARNLSEINN